MKGDYYIGSESSRYETVKPPFCTVFGDNHISGVRFRRAVLGFSSHIDTGIHSPICPILDLSSWVCNEGTFLSRDQPLL